MTPFSGKLIWGLLISGGLFMAGAIFVYYGMESGAWALLAVIGAGQIIAPLVMMKHNRDKAKRDAIARPLSGPGPRP